MRCHKRVPIRSKAHAQGFDPLREHLRTPPTDHVSGRSAHGIAAFQGFYRLVFRLGALSGTRSSLAVYSRLLFPRTVQGSDPLWREECEPRPQSLRPEDPAHLHSPLPSPAATKGTGLPTLRPSRVLSLPESPGVSSTLGPLAGLPLKRGLTVASQAAPQGDLSDRPAPHLPARNQPS